MRKTLQTTRTTDTERVVAPVDVLSWARLAKNAIKRIARKVKKGRVTQTNTNFVFRVFVFRFFFFGHRFDFSTPKTLKTFCLISLQSNFYTQSPSIKITDHHDRLPIPSRFLAVGSTGLG